MSKAAALIRQARRDAGLSQAGLARRLGVSQAAIAKLERAGSNPTIDTLDDVLWAAGRRLELGAPVRGPGETLEIIRHRSRRVAGCRYP